MQFCRIPHLFLSVFYADSWRKLLRFLLSSFFIELLIQVLGFPLSSRARLNPQPIIKEASQISQPTLVASGKQRVGPLLSPGQRKMLYPGPQVGLSLVASYIRTSLYTNLSTSGCEPILEKQDIEPNLYISA